jgi:serine/threonine protein phosphatase PrpC
LLASPEADNEVSVEVAFHTAKNWGARHENEDRCVACRDSYHPSGKARMDFHTIGIMDGHDTEIASDLVSKRLPKVISKYLKAGEPLLEAYTATMAELEDELKQVASTAGTCVNSCTVAGRFVWCANLGDCRSALVQLKAPSSTDPALGQPPAASAASGRRSGSVGVTAAPKVSSLVWMSKDQKASSPEETERIRKAGYVVEGGRCAGLEPSRTLGDFDVKMHTGKGVISIEPEVRCQELLFPEGGHPAQAILVCASDGVWDCITGQDICDLVHARKEIRKLQATIGQDAHANSRPLKDLAEDLVQFSIGRGSQDDCTAVVAMISIKNKAGS